VSDVDYVWRGHFANEELNRLHADAFDHRVYDNSEWDWFALCTSHSLGWVTARFDGGLVGFVNVISDGFVHAWIQDEMVASTARHRGIGVGLVHIARDAAKEAGCEWLHVDFDDDLKPFYYVAAGFKPTNGGLIDLTETD
jgi:GNAT superfamily N-acetyltransferase